MHNTQYTICNTQENIHNTPYTIHSTQESVHNEQRTGTAEGAGTMKNTENAELMRYEVVKSLYDMSLEELKKFKALAYGNVSAAVDSLIDKAEQLKENN